MKKYIAKRMLKDLNMCIDSPDYEITEEDFFIILKNYLKVEE